MMQRTLLHATGEVPEWAHDLDLVVPLSKPRNTTASQEAEHEPEAEPSDSPGDLVVVLELPRETRFTYASNEDGSAVLDKDRNRVKTSYSMIVLSSQQLFQGIDLHFARLE